LLKSVENIDRRLSAPEKREGRGQVAANEPARGGQQGPASSRLGSAGLGNAIKEQIQPCWTLPQGAQGLAGLVVPINIRLGPDGTVRSAQPVEAMRMQTDPVYRAVAEAAVRATYQCSPLKLTPYDYQDWRNLTLNFRPDQM
jgi:hypothetical protein